MRAQARVLFERHLFRALARIPDGVARRLAGRPLVVDGVPLDAHLQLGLRADGQRARLDAYPPPESREAFARTTAAFAPPEIALPLVTDRAVRGAAGPLRARWYHGAPPDAERPRGVLVYYHGGGHVVGDIETHDPVCRLLARRSGATVVSVDYRLAPEAPFPAGVDDAIAAYRDVRAQAAEHGCDPRRVGVAGDSAGGNLAAVTAIATRADGGGGPACQILLYPSLCVPREAMPSYRHFADGFGLDASTIVWFRDHYLPRRTDVRDWRVSPLFAPEVAGLAPAWVATAGFDPLRDEGAAYADRLQRAGVDVTYACRGDMIHGFAHLYGLLPSARVALEQAADAARAWLVAG